MSQRKVASLIKMTLTSTLIAIPILINKSNGVICKEEIEKPTGKTETKIKRMLVVKNFHKKKDKL